MLENRQTLRLTKKPNLLFMDLLIIKDSAMVEANERRTSYQIGLKEMVVHFILYIS
jgi:hypothetical protein